VSRFVKKKMPGRQEPKQEPSNALTKQPAPRLDWMEKSDLDECFRKLSEIGAPIYISIQQYTLIATTNKDAAQKFAISDYVSNIPRLHFKHQRKAFQA